MNVKIRFRYLILILSLVSMLFSCVSEAEEVREKFLSKRETVYNNFDKFKEKFEQVKQASDYKLYLFLKKICNGISLDSNNEDNYGCFSTIKYDKYSKYIKNREVNIEYMTLNGYKYYIGNIVVDEVNELVKRNQEYLDLFDIIYKDSFLSNSHLSYELGSKLLSSPIREMQKRKENYIADFIEKKYLVLKKYYGRYDAVFYKKEPNDTKINEIEPIPITPINLDFNPYAFDYDRYYFFPIAAGSIAQWVHDRAVLFCSYNRSNSILYYIYWDDSLNFYLADYMKYLFIYQGVFEYTNVIGGKNIVPVFKMIEKSYYDEDDIKKLAEQSWEKEGKKAWEKEIKNIINNKEDDLINNP